MAGGLVFSLEPVDIESAPLRECGALFDTLSDPPFFARPTWFAALAAAAGNRTKFFLLAGRRDSVLYLAALIGLRRELPFVEVAYFNESGIPALDKVFVEYNDFIGCGGDIDAKVSALKFLIHERPSIDRLVLKNCRDDIKEAVTKLNGEKLWHSGVTRTRTAFGVDLLLLPATKGSYVAALGKSTRSKIRRSIKNLEIIGPLTIERADTEQERIAAWRSLIVLHESAWSVRHRRSTFLGRELSLFHEALIYSEQSKIDLLTIKAGLSVIGVLYCFRAGVGAYYYQSGLSYDATDQHFLPGYVCHSMAVDYYRSAGFERYNFMSGMGAYKERLSKKSCEFASFELTKPGISSSIFILKHRIRRIAAFNY